MPVRALVVDDEQSILLTLSLILKSKGFEVQTASSAEIAKTHLAETAFDLLITDLSLETPAAGYDIVRAAREQSHKPATMVISAFPDLLSRWKREGADAALQKPAEIPELLTVIERLLSVRG
jgi:DNA-binding response OmpR family regulator